MGMKLSVIILNYNSSGYTLDCVNSILKHTNLIDYEVIVVDNGSTDSTKKVCESFNESVKNFIYFYDDEPGLLTGRHKGIELSTGKILCFLDDDVELNDKYIQGVLDVFSTDAEVHFATGPCLPEYEVTPPYWLDYFWVHINQGKYCFWLSLLDLGDQKLIIDPNLVFGLNFCVRKETVLKLGGFHP
ncbi:MAG: glycosyltransferase family 2 protein, partial [Chitinophagaceae bacterium]